MTSPAKKRPLTIFDSIVLGFISLVETPPLVIIASSMGRNPDILTRKAFISSPNLRRSSFVIPFIFCSGAIPESFTATGISFAGRSLRIPF